MKGRAYEIGMGVARAAKARPHEAAHGDPPFRPLRIFALDPSISRFDGAVATVRVPYEPLGKGSALFLIDDVDERGRRYRNLVFDDPAVLMTSGHTPSAADPLFHQQMVYAVSCVVYDTFRRALGRDLAWGFRRDTDQGRLVLKPHAFRGHNAYYDSTKGEVAFGYEKAGPNAVPPVLPGGLVFSCLSHDVIAHELSHAIIDGLRAEFLHASGPDVLAFHEGLADLVALFLHFTYPDVVSAAIRRSPDALEKDLLSEIAREFGLATGRRGALRKAVEELEDVEPEDASRPERAERAKRPRKALRYDASLGPHELGAVLVAAVFDAFCSVYRRRTERLRRTALFHGLSSKGPLPRELEELLAEDAARLAKQFLAIIIRAIDYCPPVDLELGEFLRAVITADRELVPEDPWGYREALVSSFLARGIVPSDVEMGSEQSLAWRGLAKDLPTIEELTFSELCFDGDPSRPSDERELQRQASALGEVVSARHNLELFGLCPPGSAVQRCGSAARPVIQSIRTARRIGPDGRALFDLVAEVTQEVRVASPGEPGISFFGGATVIIDPRGKVRYAVVKNLASETRLCRSESFQKGRGRRFFRLEGANLVSRDAARMLDDEG